MKKLTRGFYARPALVVAKDLLGKLVVRKWRGKDIAGKIVETEAYIGPHDKAAHGFNWRKTKRNEVEYLSGGRIYIYLVYGMYWQLNITTGLSGQPECVLIRALEPISSSGIIPNGPGKLCNYLKMDKSFYGEDLTKSKKIWLEESGEKIKKSDIIAARRIGIDYAQEWAEKPWRFYLKDNLFVSKK